MKKNNQSTGTIADNFNVSRYITNVDDYTRTHSNPFSFRAQNLLVKFEITFIDSSKRVVIMTSRQSDAMRRRNDWNLVKSVGGLGYQKLIANN